MDFHEPVLASDLWSIGGMSCCLELSVGKEDLLTLEVPAVKNSSYRGPNRKSNSCCDGDVVSAEGETFYADIVKITRKQLKPGKHKHGNGRARKEPGWYGSLWQSNTSSKLSYWSSPQEEDHGYMKKAQGNEVFTLILLTKLTHKADTSRIAMLAIRVCKSDPRVENELPMIEQGWMDKIRGTYNCLKSLEDSFSCYKRTHILTHIDT
ncbi:hypothetical protein Tco_0831096 [Tanacetum coccineum]